MSLHNYHVALKISLDDVPFYALIMASMLKADSDNTEKLKRIFPEVSDELRMRYNAPLGVLESEKGTVDMDLLRQQVANL